MHLLEVPVSVMVLSTGALEGFLWINLLKKFLTPLSITKKKKLK